MQVWAIQMGNIYHMCTHGYGRSHISHLYMSCTRAAKTLRVINAVLVTYILARGSFIKAEGYWIAWNIHRTSSDVIGQPQGN
jgi:hypothetical protein